EILMATVAEEPASSPPTSEPAPESISKEAVADPTIKPVPLKPEKPKEPEKKKEKPREKPKPIPKQKPKPAVEQPHAVKAEKTIISNDSVNSKATTTGNVTSKNPNLTGSGSSSDEIKAYQSALRREIEQHKKYSQRAKMMRKQGIVRVAFNVGNDGSISGVRVTSSSGSEDLDKSALNAVQSARSVGPRPSGMNSTQTVPISFTIQ
ncbi:MAG TPA: energy transducer TonB, partial [Pasteurellaceae bacterium]|nr:energy transducer TonB [Pasteurellaceae bacterium]